MLHSLVSSLTSIPRCTTRNTPVRPDETPASPTPPWSSATSTCFRLSTPTRSSLNVEARVRAVLGEVKFATPDILGRTRMNTCRTNAFLDEYYCAVRADSEEAFEQSRINLRRMDKGLANYLDNTWWKYKEKIVKYWTDKHLHFGILDTSTVEGTHAKIKSWLESSKGDLLTVFNKLLPWWKSATNAVSLQAQRDARSVPFKLSDLTFSSVIKVITIHGLSETHSRWQLAIKMVHERIKHPEKQTQIQPCTGSYRRCYGLPCLHERIRIYESNYSITLQPHDFDRHWFVRGTRVVQTDEVLETARRTKQRRGASKQHLHQAGSGVNSTRRDPSQFELINSDIIASEAVPIHTQTFYELLVSDDHLQDSGGVDAFLPPRAWGFAGLQ